MEVCSKYLAPLLFIVLITSCSSESDLSERLLDSQVERLLSGQQLTKRWGQRNEASSCRDSVLLEISLVENAENDSLDIFRIANDQSCEETETYIGRADASRILSSAAFTDSLVFSSGDYWLIENVTSQKLSLQIQEEVFSYQADN